MEAGFEQGNSNNLPKIGFIMVNNFFIKNVDYRNAEVQNVKMKRATREDYGDNAIGYVQLKRENDMCIIKGKITPEHRVTSKGYAVTVTVKENEEVISCECHDCLASDGGCKHAVAFLMWLHRRSGEPSVTSVTCYWRTSKLSKVGKSLKGSTIPEMYGQKMQRTSELKKGDCRTKFLEQGRLYDSQSLLFQLFEEDAVEKVSLHCLSIKYEEYLKENSLQADADNFVEYCKKTMKADDCVAVQNITINQHKTSKWYAARFARITASKIFEASRCKTFDGSLTEAVFGSSKITTDSMERGLRLEEAVLDCVAKKLKINIKKCGLVIKPEYPIFGASPDGITEKLCIEVKCPSKAKSVGSYVDPNNKICPKPFAQLQMQMFLTEKSHGLLCVASPKFEIDEQVNVIEIELDKEFCEIMMKDAYSFWKNAIFNKIVQ